MQVSKIRVIHRGFLLEKNKIQNIPEWQIAIELQNRFPDLPLLIDPSHIQEIEMILEVTQKP
jgi:chorismate mutase